MMSTCQDPGRLRYKGLRPGGMRLVVWLLLVILAWGLGQARASAGPDVLAVGPDSALGDKAPGTSYPLGLLPPRTSGPLVVGVRLDINDINEIDDSAETFEFNGVMTLRWQDPRLAFDPALEGLDDKIYTGNFQVDEVFPGWCPQVVLVNAAGLYDKSGVMLRVQPDGTSTLIETINAMAESKLRMRRLPFDSQRLEAAFQVLGFDKDEVQLVPAMAPAGAPASLVQIPQWEVKGISTSSEERVAPYAGRGGVASTLVLAVDVKRLPFHLMRLIVFPLMVIVLLSFTVFWMDRAAIGDRVSVSFIGILTAVAYLMVTNDQMPHIAYVTLMHGFLNISLIIMTLTVVVNLIVGALDHRGESERSNRIDHLCRWAFPLAYFCLLGVITASAFIFY